MKKELVWAIITGFGLGLVITYGVLSAKKAIKPKLKEIKQTEISTTPIVPPISLEIEKPKDESIINEEKTLLIGKTNPRAILAIFTEEDELIIEADEKGRFETEIELVGGANEITVITFDDEGNEASQSMTIVYTTAEI